MNWLRKLLYEWSCHTDIEQALDDKLAMGKRIGRDYCPRCEITRLVEIELGLFTCPYCRMDTDADIYLSTPNEIMSISPRHHLQPLPAYALVLLAAAWHRQLLAVLAML